MKKIALLFTMLFALLYSAAASEILSFVPKGPYVSDVAASLDLTFSWNTLSATTASATFTVTGRELLLVHNAATSSATFTITGATDEYGQLGRFQNLAISSGSVLAYWFGARDGWDNGAGVTINSGTNALKLAVAKITQRFNPISKISTTRHYASSTGIGPYVNAINQESEMKITMASTIASATTFALTGRDVLIWHNEGAESTVRLTGSTNPYNRTMYMPSDTTYTVDADQWGMYVLSNTNGWLRSDGNCLLTAGGTSIKFGILVIPLR